VQFLRIRAYLQDGRVAGTDPWFPLDGILQYAFVRKHDHKILYTSAVGLQPETLSFDLPLVKRNAESDDWYWACSFNTTRPVYEYAVHWHKCFDDHLVRFIDFQGKRAKISRASGRYRAYRMPLYLLLFDFLEWFAVGLREEVEDLCKYITHIGKKTSQGFGAIDHWEITEIPEDWSETKGESLTRPVVYTGQVIPNGCHLSWLGIRPPYWCTQNWRLCVWKAG